jgi:two-component system phosphate regulon response regulator OmpR
MSAKIESAALADDAPHLLVVDDDSRIRELLSRYLRGEGYRVTTSETAADARAKLGGLHFDLMVLDVMMPGETGFAFARSLRASSNIPIVMLTARGEAESRIEGLECGADDYLGKPFEPRELSLRISNILRRARPATPPPIESVRFGEFQFHLARGELLTVCQLRLLNLNRRELASVRQVITMISLENSLSTDATQEEEGVSAQFRAGGRGVRCCVYLR